MPDFFAFETLVRTGMVADEADIPAIAKSVAKLSDTHRPQLFKRRSEGEIAGWLRRARAFLFARYGPEARFSTSRNNRDRYDLEVDGSDELIELKTGAVTDANSGLSTIAWALGDPTPSIELMRIMAHSMRTRRDAFMRGDARGIAESRVQTMDELEAYLRSRLRIGQPPPPRLELFVRAVARGITKRGEIEALVDIDTADWQAPVTLHADWVNGWGVVDRAFEPDEPIVVDSINRAPARTSGPAARVEVRLRGTRSGRVVKLYPNYKNSYKASDGTRIPAANWVQTACFHVWVD